MSRVLRHPVNHFFGEPNHLVVARHLAIVFIRPGADAEIDNRILRTNHFRDAAMFCRRCLGDFAKVCALGFGER